MSALGCEYNNRNTQLERIISHHPTSTKLYIIENTQDMIRLICLLATTTMANTLPCPSGNRNGRQHFVILYSAPTFILLNNLLRTRIQLECGYQKRMNSDITDDEDFGGSGDEGSGEYGSGACDPFNTRSIDPSVESGVFNDEVTFAGLSIVTWVRDWTGLSKTLFMLWVL